MVKKYSYGKVFVTDAVIENIMCSDERVEYFDIQDNKDGYELTRTMHTNDVVYGLGQSVRGINKRGWIYRMNNTDDPVHSEDKTSLYGSHGFAVFDGETDKFGVFIDYPGQYTFDIGYSDIDEMKIIIPNDTNDKKPEFDVYIIIGDSVNDIVKQFRRIIGKSYIPPRWAFGYGQSRWSYQDEAAVREVIKSHRDNNIPLDSVYLDIDYMDNFKDFTVSEEKFPDFKEFVDEVKSENVHLVPIIDAGIKIEKGYKIYDEGIQNGYFCKDENGKEYEVTVWPGLTHLPDFLNPDAGKWFGRQYKTLIDDGIDGFWNDMNEPAIFNMDEKDYDSFYHETPEGRVRHSDVHNLYGYNMTRAAGEAFDKLSPDTRLLLFSRSSYIGMHRYGGMWMGDNMSWWSHLLLNLKMLPSLNMCGFMYTGADIGGFGGNVTEELLLRWMALGVFTPLMRNHSALGTRRQEVYRYKNIDAFRNIITLRYALLPYIYSEYMKAVINDDMLFKPLGFVYSEDAAAKRVEDQLLLGESIMIAPIYTQNAVGRYVYLPEKMKLIRFRGANEYSCEILEKGHHYIDVSTDEVPVFLRYDRMLILGNGACSENEIDYQNLRAITFSDEVIKYMYYNDDGYTKDINNKNNIRELLSSDMEE